MGIATVPVAAIGVSPMARTPDKTERDVPSHAFDLFGGTPNSARETRAIPGTPVDAHLPNR